MSATFAPFGLAPTLNQSGIIRVSPTPGVITSGFATNIFLNAPVQVDASGATGAIIPAPAQGAGSAAPALANRIIGTFQGAEFTLTATGRRTVSNFWPANTVATQIVGWYTRDPWLTYEIQANGPVAQANLGNQASITANGSLNGNTTTGFSIVALDVTTANSLVGPTSNPTFFNQLRIVGFSQRVDNAVGDAFTIVQVQVSMHQDVANQSTY